MYLVLRLSTCIHSSLSSMPILAW